LRGPFFTVGSQAFFLWRLIGALAIIIGFAMLIGAVFTASDGWKALKYYPNCIEGLDPAYPEYSQLKVQSCQDSFQNITGVQLPLQNTNQITNTLKAEVLLNSIIKICFSVAVILFGIILYRPFPLAKKASQKGKKK